MDMDGLSRRSFLKLSGLSAAGLSFINLPALSDEQPGQQGRVAEEKVSVFDQPSFAANSTATLWRDTVIPITAATLGEGEPAHNRVWYQTENGGFVHSGTIQPVRTLLNPTDGEIPRSGILAEVTVPFTDAHWRVDKKSPVVYRMYYETTHWVSRRVHDSGGNPWYQLHDDKWKFYYYVPASHLRLLYPTELSQISADVPPESKRILVNTGAQMVVAFEYDKPVYMARAATGARFSNGDFRTQPGFHITAHKRPYRHMAAGNLAYNGYDLPGVPWICYITENGISFHGTYWHNNFGLPRSHGCINLSPQAARWIYRWTDPVVPPAEQVRIASTGTLVEIVAGEE